MSIRSCISHEPIRTVNSVGRLGSAERMGLYGFRAATHILAQILRMRGERVYAFTRPGDEPCRRRGFISVLSFF